LFFEKFSILNSFHSLCVLHLVSLDIQADFKKDLQQLMFDLRLECFKVIMDHACLGKFFLNNQKKYLMLGVISFIRYTD
jgi:hypothetical protein